MSELEFHLQQQANGPVAVITLNRADKKNAMTRAMWAQLATLIELAEQQARVLQIRANGDDFCAGADVSELRANIQDQAWMQANHRDVQAAQQKLYQCKLPTVAVIHGACFGGGLGIATACDFRIASVHSRFALTPAKLGLAYSIADCKRLVDLIGHARSKEMLFTAQAIPAVQALTFGLIHQMHAVNTIDHAVSSLTQDLLANSASAIALIKHHLWRIANGACQDDAASQAEFAAMFNSPDFAEGAAAFLEKRAVHFGG